MTVAIVVEAECGVMPGSGVWTYLPIQEGTALSLTKNFERSAVINATRQGGKQIGGTSTVEGTLITPVTLDSGVILLLESALGGQTAAGGVLKADAVFTTFTIEFGYLTSPPTGRTYERFLGCVVNTMSIDLPTTGGATANWGILGQSMVIATGPAPGYTYGPVPGALPMAGSADLSEATMNGAPLEGVATGTINTTNNAEAKFAIGDSFTDHVVLGDFDATMDLTIYYRGSTQTQYFLDEVRNNIGLKLANANDETMEFRLPEAVYVTADKGNDGPSMTEALSAFGEYDTTEATKMVVTRAPAAMADLEADLEALRGPAFIPEEQLEGQGPEPGREEPGPGRQAPGQPQPRPGPGQPTQRPSQPPPPQPGRGSGQPGQYPGQPPPQRRQEKASGEDRGE